VKKVKKCGNVEIVKNVEIIEKVEVEKLESVKSGKIE
jgi:hypothetical protein